MKRRKRPDDDDGTVIANMNVDGMPWFLKHTNGGKIKGSAYEMSKEESRAYMKGALTASFIVVAFFGLVFAALIVSIIYLSQ